jgi:hypothetical protein
MSEQYTTDEPSPTRIQRISACSPRTALALGATAWTGAAAVLILHVVGVFRSDLYFGMTDTWLVALGCYGTPIALIRGLGRRLGESACLHIAWALGAVAAAITALAAVGEMRPSPVDIVFSLVLLLAGSIHSSGAYDIKRQLRQAHARGYREGRLDGHVECAQAVKARAADLHNLDEMSLDELEKRHAALGRAIQERRAGFAGYAGPTLVPAFKPVNGETRPRRTGAR